MAKFSEASDYVANLVNNVSNEMGLSQMGVDIEPLCVLKSKEVVSVSKASSVVEYMSDREDLVLVFVYERAFEKVDEANQYLWVRMALEQIFVDTEKEGKISIGCPMVTVPLSLLESDKFKDVVIPSSRLAQYTLAQIKDEDEQKKAEQKAQKKTNKKKF